MFCTIWYCLYNFKNMKNTHGGSLLLVKLQVFSFLSFSESLKCLMNLQSTKRMDGIFQKQENYFLLTIQFNVLVSPDNEGWTNKLLLSKKPKNSSFKKEIYYYLWNRYYLFQRISNLARPSSRH